MITVFWDISWVVFHSTRFTADSREFCLMLINSSLLFRAVSVFFHDFAFDFLFKHSIFSHCKVKAIIDTRNGCDGLIVGHFGYFYQLLLIWAGNLGCYFRLFFPMHPHRQKNKFIEKMLNLIFFWKYQTRQVLLFILHFYWIL